MGELKRRIRLCAVAGYSRRPYTRTFLEKLKANNTKILHGVRCVSTYFHHCRCIKLIFDEVDLKSLFFANKIQNATFFAIISQNVMY